MRFVSVMVLFVALAVTILSEKANAGSISNVSSGTASANNGGYINGSYEQAFVFQTGSQSSAITDISLGFIANSVSTSTFTLELWNAGGSYPYVPTSLVASVSNLSFTTGSSISVANVNTYSGGTLGGIASATLNASTKYAIVIKSSASAGTYLGLDNNSSYTAQGGWTFQNSNISSNGGTSWLNVNAGNKFLVGINNNPPPPPPTVTSISPTSGSTVGGDTITITGANLTGATGITVGGAACTAFNVASATSATCTTPAGTAGAASVVVTTGGGSNTANTLFTYITPASIPSLSEWTQFMLGLMVITLVGWHFQRERSY